MKPMRIMLNESLAKATRIWAWTSCDTYMQVIVSELDYNHAETNHMVVNA